MNTFRGAAARLEGGGFTALLGLVLVLMIGGLVATDHVLRNLAMGRRADDAARAGLQLERIINARDTGLTILQELGGPGKGQAIDVQAFHALARDYAKGRGGIRRLVLADSSGVTLAEERFGDTVPDSVLVGTAMNTAHRGGLADASILRLRTGPPLLIVAQPLEGARHQWAVAVLDLSVINNTLSALLPESGDRLTLVTPDDTVQLSPSPSGSTGGLRINAAPVRLPDGTAWTLLVGQVDEVSGIRRGLWVFGVLTVFLLGSIVIRERRDALRIRERSAELERLSGELLRANRMKSEFLANVSHELRTPLNAIVGFVELLKDGAYGDLSPRQVGPVDRIAVSAMHLRHLVDQVLDIAKIAAGRLEVHTETISLRSFVLNVASELESLISERGLSFSISIPATLPRVRIDPTHLRQILVNLIGNAVKYTPAGGVAVRARLIAPGGGGVPAGPRRTPDDAVLTMLAPDKSRSWIALQVVDTGIGVPPNDHERIFDEFEQVNAGARGDSIARGTGLGLAISRRLARLLGGEITVESQVGKGSTFTVWIAVQAGGDRGTSPSDSAAATSQN